MDPPGYTAPSAKKRKSFGVLTEAKVSTKFSSATADVTFISSDHIMFMIHSEHIASCSAGLVDSNTIMNPGNPISLPEPAVILELLFQFIEPPSQEANYRQPTVTEIDPVTFFDLAEAAEKYIVYSAMSLCIARMRLPGTIKDYSFEVLNHSMLHGYPELANEAAVRTKSVPNPLKTAALHIKSLETIQRWLVYYERRRNSDIFTAISVVKNE